MAETKGNPICSMSTTPKHKPLQAWTQADTAKQRNTNQNRGVRFRGDDRRYDRPTAGKARPKTAPGGTGRSSRLNREQRPESGMATRDVRPATNSGDRSLNAWTNDQEIECVRRKAFIKKRYWKAVQGIGTEVLEKSGLEVQKRRQEVKQLYRDFLQVEEENEVKNIVFPPWKNDSAHYRNHKIAWSIPVLDNDILGLKKRLDAIRWTKDKKKIKVEEQTKELESMKRIYDSVTEEIHKDPIWKKIQEKTNEENQMAMQMDHAENIRNHYRKCNMIVRKGNVLLAKKIDQLEEVAERLAHEKWELYGIKVEATYLRDDCLAGAEAMAKKVYANRSKNEMRLNEIRTHIHYESIPKSLLEKIQGLDSAEAAQAITALAHLGKIKSIKEKAYGSEGLSGPKLRKLAFKLIRMKYEEQKNTRAAALTTAMTSLENATKAETVNEILAAFKEQKDITIFLEDAVGKLRVKQAMLIKQREDLQARRDALVARHSKGIADYDDEGRRKHREIEKWQKKGEDGEKVKETAGRLVKQIHGALRSLSADIHTKDVNPIKPEQRETVAFPRGTVALTARKSTIRTHAVSSDSREEWQRKLKMLNDVDDSSPKTSFNDEHPTLKLMRKVQNQLDDLLARKEKIPKAQSKIISAKFGFGQDHPHAHVQSDFQEYAENAIYANPRITWKPSNEEDDDDDVSVENDREEERADDVILDNKQMKEYSQHVIEEHKARLFHVEEEAKPRGDWHKYC